MSSSCRKAKARRRAPRRDRPGGMVLAAAVLLAAAAGTQPARSQGVAEDHDWPCVQREVPSISPGMVWAGPPLDEVGDAWQDDPTVAALAVEIASRRTPIEEAKAAIERFAKDAGADKERRLTMLFAGALETINHNRASIIAGIERYATKQEALAGKIEHQAAELAALPNDGTPAQTSKRADLQEIQHWDVRIFEERERSLTYVCDQPVLLEKRAFALGRDIGSYLD